MIEMLEKNNWHQTLQNWIEKTGQRFTSIRQLIFLKERQQKNGDLHIIIQLANNVGIQGIFMRITCIMELEGF